LIPGYNAPGSDAQPAMVARALVTWEAFDTTASPAGWINDGVNETLGNNVDAHTDLYNLDQPDLPRPHGSPTRVFDFPLDLSQDPSTYRKAAIVNLFYWNNWMHDRLYQLGFDENSGNFQQNNFGRGGKGNDPVQADAQDGGDFNNANFSYTADGYSPRMQMYIYNSPDPNRDGDFDASIICHEYTHGLSDRLVGGGVGISKLQTQGMGEGWSDFYSLALLVPSSASLGASYPEGAYAMWGYNKAGAFAHDGDNYYFGVRRYPYSTNLAVNPLTFKDIDAAQISDHNGVPRSPLWAGSYAGEVHNMGEVWCVTLWEARARLIGKYGYATGNELILQLVTDGMKLSPPNPTFTQARDAILQADQVLNGGADNAELWAAFAKRGLGADALAGYNYETQVIESFTATPDSLFVTETTSGSASGIFGGPFNSWPSSLTLSNRSASSLSWSSSADPLLVLSPSSGTLAAHGAVSVAVGANTNLADALQQPWANASLQFSNRITHVTHSRQYQVSVSEPLTVSDDSISFYSIMLRGVKGGPFAPLFPPVNLVNRSDAPMPWVATVPEPFALTPTSGTLAPHSTNVLALTGSPSANLLDYGTYKGNLYVTNQASGQLIKNSLELGVLNDGYLTEYFDTQTSFDLANTRLTFIPNGSDSYYAVCREPALGFSSDPTGGTQLHKDTYGYDDDATVLLTAGKAVSLFGYVTNQVVVNFEGSVNVDRADGYPNSHFDRRRVSAMGDFYSQSDSLDAGAVVAWKQLSDRFAVTWQNIVTEYIPRTTNNFQIELFFDGTIRITILDAPTNSAPAVGLSRGMGNPADFASTHFSSFGDCAHLFPDLTVSTPASYTEGQIHRLNEGRVTIPTPMPTNLVVQLSSSDTSEIAVPATITIPSGSTGAVFNVTVVNDSILDGTRAATVKASAPGFNTGQTFILVNDNESTPLYLDLPGAITEGDPFITGRVFTKVAVGDDVIVFLSADPPGQVEFSGFLPFTIIPNGQTSAVFQVRAPDNTLIDGTRLVSIGASVSNWPSATTTVQVLDNENTNLTLVSGIFFMEGTGLLSNMAEVRISGELATNLTVDVTCDDYSAVWPLGPVIIPAGKTNALFNLFLWDNNTIDPVRLITMTASATGFANGQWSFFLFDNDGPPTPLKPSPYNFAEGVALTADLSWEPQEGELIVNGGFESQLSGWTREDSGAGGWVSAFPEYDPPGPDGPQAALAGIYCALSQQYGNGRHALWQEVSIPSSASPVQLTWSHRIHNHALTFATNQQFRVEIRDHTNAVLATLYETTTNGPLIGDWTNQVADLWAFRGKTIRIAFVEEDALGELNVSVDAVSLVATPPAPTTWLVYFGTTPTPGAAQYLGSTTNTTWALGTLATSTTYYWQVKSVRGGQTNTGPVWQFTTTDTTNRPPVIGLGSPGVFAIYRDPADVAFSFRLLSDDGKINSLQYYGDGALLGQQSIAPWGFTWSKPLPGEHTVWVVATDNGGLSSTSAVRYISVLPSSGALMTVVPFGSSWKYLDDGANMGITWRSGGRTLFSDLFWSEGVGPLGYGHGNEGTLLNFGPDYNSKYMTYYFRRGFGFVPNAQNLILRVFRDDGVAVYLNGHEVLRNNLAPAADYLTAATFDINGGLENVPISASISPTNLVGRANLLAAEVHQSGPTSPDLVFDLELSAVVNPQPSVSVVSPLANALFTQPANVSLIASAADPYGTVAQVEFFADGSSLGVVGSTPYALTWSNAPAGLHSLTAVVTDDLGATNVSAPVVVDVASVVPRVSISTGANGISIAWPSAAVGYHLESTTSLVSPVTWSPWTDPSLVISNNQLVLPMPSGQTSPRFFRLVAP
jgi:hypothetical protein